MRVCFLLARHKLEKRNSSGVPSLSSLPAAAVCTSCLESNPSIPFVPECIVFFSQFQLACQFHEPLSAIDNYYQVPAANSSHASRIQPVEANVMLSYIMILSTSIPLCFILRRLLSVLIAHAWAPGFLRSASWKTRHLGTV